MKKSKNMSEWIIGIILGAISLVGFIIFLSIVWASNMLSPLYIGLICAFGVLAAVVTALLTRAPKGHKVWFVIGVCWLVICLVIYTVGGVFVSKTKSAMIEITDTNTEEVHISFYVKKDDPIQDIRDSGNYKFGIISTLDRENTDIALQTVAQEESVTLQTKEYDGLVQLADGLLNGEVNGIILNEGYLTLYEEIDGYQNFPQEVRVLFTQTLEHDLASDGSGQGKSDLSELGDTVNIYISGSDTRESSLPVRSRSDVNIIASVNLKTHKVLLLSTPRDYYVPLSVSNGVRDKLTHAGIYGVQTSIDTLEMFYGINIDYYFRINFTGFEKIVDALGGIEVQSDYEFESRGCHFNKGINYLNGKEALVYCRERYSFAEGDRQRGKNQMEVIKAIANKSASPAILTNYLTILKSVQGYMETNIPYDLIAQMVQEQLTNNYKWELSTYSVNGTGDSQIPYSMSVYAYVMIPDMETVEYAKELLNQIEMGN